MHESVRVCVLCVLFVAPPLLLRGALKCAQLFHGATKPIQETPHASVDLYRILFGG